MKIRLNQPVYEDPRRSTIMEDLKKTKYALEAAYSGFDNVTDPDLIDSYIYELNAVFKRYKFLLEEAAKLDSPPLPEDSALYEKTTLQALV